MYEVNCLIIEEMYSKDNLLLGIRRCLRGEAAAVAMRLGESASVADVLDTFHAAFGNTETPEYTLQRSMDVYRKRRTCGQSRS